MKTPPKPWLLPSPITIISLSRYYSARVTWDEVLQVYIVVPHYLNYKN